MRCEAVLFDLDGTLVDSGPLILASFRYATRTVLGRTVPDEELMAGVGGHGLDAQMRAIDSDRVDELTRVYRAHNLKEYERVQLFAGIRDVLERLRAQRRALGVVTVKGRPAVDLTFELLELADIFDVVVTADDTVRQKPAPDPLLAALAQLGVPASAAAYVGDAPFDIQAARGAGVRAVAVTWGGIHPVARLEREEPDVIVQQPNEVLDVV
jgi:pyrophosphatase PpaX